MEIAKLHLDRTTFPLDTQGVQMGVITQGEDRFGNPLYLTTSPHRPDASWVTHTKGAATHILWCIHEVAGSQRVRGVA